MADPSLGLRGHLVRTSLGHSGCWTRSPTWTLRQTQPLQAPEQRGADGTKGNWGDTSSNHAHEGGSTSLGTQDPREARHASQAGQGPAPAEHQGDGPSPARAGRQQGWLPCGAKAGRDWAEAAHGDSKCRSRGRGQATFPRRSLSVLPVGGPSAGRPALLHTHVCSRTHTMLLLHFNRGRVPMDPSKV